MLVIKAGSWEHPIVLMDQGSSASQAELMGKDERSPFPSFPLPRGENTPGALQEVGVNPYENQIIMSWQSCCYWLHEQHKSDT